MLRLALPLLVAVGALGCAAPADQDPATEVGENAFTPFSLREQTALERAKVLSGEGSVVVAYDPPGEELYARSVGRSRVRYEAVRLDPAPESSSTGAEEPTDLTFATEDAFGNGAAPSAETAITVKGDFPTSARVIVTDDAFNVVARGWTNDAKGVGEAHVIVPPSSTPRFVLVRDLSWVKPMTFEVSVTR
jgi:hypothetical protein